jgi:hypothetical protein
MAEKCLSVGLCRFVFVIGKKSMNRSVTRPYKSRPLGAWIVVYPSAIMVAL